MYRSCPRCRQTVPEAPHCCACGLAFLPAVPWQARKRLLWPYVLACAALPVLLLCLLLARPMSAQRTNAAMPELPAPPELHRVLLTDQLVSKIGFPDETVAVRERDGRSMDWWIYHRPEQKIVAVVDTMHRVQRIFALPNR